MKRKIILKSLILIFSIFIIGRVNVYALENGWNTVDEGTYYYMDGEVYKGIKQINGKWYHFGENSGQLKKGWSKTLDGRDYYSDKDGIIQIGWYTETGQKYYLTLEEGLYKGIKQINGKWYHLGENSGQLKKGWSKTLDGRTYYAKSDGILQFGWLTVDNQKYYIELEKGAYKGIQKIGESWYHFGENSSQLKKGWSKTLDGREYYSNKDGIIQIGWYTETAQKYYLTLEEGMYKGIKQINGKWYHLGENSGQLKKGWSKTLNGRDYYSNKDGIIQIGWYTEAGQKYYLSLEEGMYKGIKQINGKWYHLGENSGQLKKGWSKTLNGRTYYANSEGVLQFDWLTVDNQKYYIELEKGAYKGIQKIGEAWYHFGENSGQVKTGISKTLNGRIYYANSEGVLQFGWLTVDSQKYYIELEKGAYKGIQKIGEAWYHLGENSGQLKKGWSKTLNGRIYYADGEGILQKGNLFIDNNWYSFADDYSLNTGWQTIDGKTYYFYADGTKAKYISKIAGTRYEFSANGELEHSNIKVIADLSFHNGTIDWNTLWNSGEIDGVILRIGYSLGQDSHFLTYLSEARRLGIPYSVYHFSIAENDYEATLEANSLVNWYQSSALTPSMGVFYDIESWRNYEDGHTSDGISIDTYDSIIRTYKSILNSKSIDMSLYTGKNYAETRLSEYARSQIGWIAHYASYCGYQGSYRGWQYTSKGKLPGVNGYVDLSIFYY